MNIANPFTVDRDAPFPHLYSPGFLSADLCSEIYDYFEQPHDWGTPQGAAEDDGVIYCMEEPLPEHLAHLESTETKSALKAWLGGKFQAKFADHCELAANKMENGHGIRPHNDFHDNAPSHRIIIFVTRDWSWEHGGELWLLKARGPQIERSGHMQYPPIAGDAVAFPISEQSYHAVQPAKAGVRYSLTYSFFPPN